MFPLFFMQGIRLQLWDQTVLERRPFFVIDVYKRQELWLLPSSTTIGALLPRPSPKNSSRPVSYTHLKIARLENDMMANATNSVKLREIMADKEAAEKQLEEKMDRWVYLNDLAERIEAQKNNG